MKTTANVGDKVKVNGRTYTIADLYFADFWHGWYIEFVDTDGHYHNWKQNIDGGEFIPAKEGE